MTVSNENTDSHVELFRYLRHLVDAAQESRLPHPKFALVEAYWHIGRIVVETEQQGQERAEYGIHLIENLSRQLTEAFGKGYSLPNMWRFKQFYLAFQILSTNGRDSINLREHLRTELHWSHYRILMQIQEKTERAFYLQTAADEGWTSRFLQRMINNRYYQHVIAGEETFFSGGSSATFPHSTGLASIPSARSRLAYVKKTLLERHNDFAFVGQRQAVRIKDQNRWADLVFYHIALQRFVLVQLGEPTPIGVAALKQLLDAYREKQSPTVTTLPLGLLVSERGSVSCVPSTDEMALSEAVRSHFPETI